MTSSCGRSGSVIFLSVLLYFLSHLHTPCIYMYNLLSPHATLPPSLHPPLTDQLTSPLHVHDHCTCTWHSLCHLHVHVHASNPSYNVPPICSFYATPTSSPPYCTLNHTSSITHHLSLIYHTSPLPITHLCTHTHTPPHHLTHFPLAVPSWLLLMSVTRCLCTMLSARSCCTRSQRPTVWPGIQAVRYSAV